MATPVPMWENQTQSTQAFWEFAQVQVSYLRTKVGLYEQKTLGYFFANRSSSRKSIYSCGGFGAAWGKVSARIPKNRGGKDYEFRFDED